MAEAHEATSGVAAPPARRPLPFVSVIIPCYNGGATLGEQLEALRAQAYAGEWEILLADNRSTDATAELVRRYAAQMPNLRYVAAFERQGRTHAINTGARAARGDALLFCDADDVAAPGWLAAMAEALRSHDFVTGALDMQTLNADGAWRPDPRSGAQKRALDFMPFATGANSGLTRAAFEAVGGFLEDEAKGEDLELSWRLQLQGYPLVDVPDAVMRYRFRQDVRGTFRQLVAYAESHVWLYRRFRPHGMPRSKLAHALQRYRRILRGIPSLRHKSWAGRDRWLADVATAWGRLVGSIKYRRLYL